jgi:hypothetical protein
VHHLEKGEMMDSFIQTIPNTVERKSTRNGNGLFTIVARQKGEVLCKLDGEVIQHNNDQALLTSTEWNAIDDDRILLRRNATSYVMINHGSRPNLTIDVGTFEMRAMRDIAKDEELVLDYLENGFPQAYLNSDRCAYLR